MKHLPKATVLAALSILLLVLFTSCRAADAGKLTASRSWPIVDVVTTRQLEYLEAGKMPDGRPLPPALAHMQRTSIATLRNMYLAALGRPLEPLPAPPDEAELAASTAAGGGQ